MIYFDSPYGTIHWDDEVRCVHLEWKGFAHGEMIQRVLNSALDLFRTKHTDRWIADTRKMRVLSPEDSQWVNEDWIPRAIQAGVRRIAVAVPESVLAQMSLRRLKGKGEGDNVEMAYFATLEEAKEWLVNGG